MATVTINKDWDTQSVQHYRTVDQIKKRMRKSNSQYLHNHPEIRAVIRFFLHEALNNRPKNIYEFAADVFNCNNTPLLVPMINQHLKRVNEQLRQGQYHEFDGDFMLTENPSSHSLLSNSSVGTSADSLLRYAVILKNSI